MSDACPSCGSPDNGEFAYCHFCNAPFSAEIAANAIPCPSCRAQNRWGRTHCGACQTWIIVTCVFCSALSPCNVPACLSCHEVFDGAAARKSVADMQRAQQEANAETAQVVTTLGSVAGSILGAVVDAELGGGRRRW